MEKKELCNICLNADLSNEKTVFGYLNPCNHYYCFNCIHQWAAIKNNCPVCLIPIDSIKKKNDGEIVEIFVSKIKNIKNNGTHEEALESLDHSYFEQEIEKLFKRLERIKQKMSQYKKDLYIDEKWRYIEILEYMLNDKLIIITELVKYNGSEFLNDIYYLDDIVKNMELNKWNEINIEDCNYYPWEENDEMIQYDDYDEYFENDCDEREFFNDKIFVVKAKKKGEKEFAAKNKKNKEIKEINKI